MFKILTTLIVRKFSAVSIGDTHFESITRPVQNCILLDLFIFLVYKIHPVS